METRARYVLVGLFALVVIAAGFGFVYWLNNSAGLNARTQYNVSFEGPVSGLLPGSAVLFNGLRVGEVTGLSLDAADPQKVLVGIAVSADTPIHNDTLVGLAFSGLTGSASIAFSGGTPDSPKPTAPDGQVPLLIANAQASEGWTDAARDFIQHLDKVIEDNADSLKDAIANIDDFSKALSRNSDKVDDILKGLSSLTGGGSKPTVVTFGLDAPKTFPPIAKLPDGQLQVSQPTALVALDTQRIIVRDGSGEVPGFDTAQWSDSLPQLFQSTIVEAFENAGFPKVDRSTDGFASDFELVLDIRDFEISQTPTPTAVVAVAARVMTKDGKLAATKVFEANSAVNGADAAAAAAALNEGFGKILTDLVPWTLANMQATPGTDAPPPDDSAPPPADNAPAPDANAPAPDANAPAAPAPDGNVPPPPDADTPPPAAAPAAPAPAQ